MARRRAVALLALIAITLLLPLASVSIAAGTKGTSKAKTTPAASTPAASTPGGSTPAVPSAGSGLSGFPNPPVATTSTSPTVAANTSTASQGSSAFSSSTALVIVIAALVVISAIAFFIWRDARRRAPVREVAGPMDGGRAKPGSKAPPRPRKLSPAERRRRKRGRAKR
ncbi:MAG TPA: hypothetical protein VFN55_14215 [Solirubrobacteraceae bacterium]|nr:hypothetical protein [Solirubrobacteraceae bacterium]